MTIVPSVAVALLVHGPKPDTMDEHHCPTMVAERWTSPFSMKMKHTGGLSELRGFFFLHQSDPRRGEVGRDSYRGGGSHPKLVSVVGRADR